MTMLDVNIGLSESVRKDIADHLSHLLADSYTLYVKSHNFHWNVTGPHFQELHQLFETHYKDLGDAVDQIAERIRALGFFAPGSCAQFTALSSLQEETRVPSWENMVEQLLEGHETVVRTCREALTVSQDAGDESTSNLIGDRMRVHEKTAWMLRSLLE